MAEMKIRSGPATRRTPVREDQALFLAACIRALNEDLVAVLGPGTRPDPRSSEKLWALRSYQIFCDAAYACGFVCTDLAPTYPLSAAHQSPDTTVGHEPFGKIRHFLHTLLRAERANNMTGCISPVLTAITSGALAVVAQRLESDATLREDEAN